MNNKKYKSLLTFSKKKCISGCSWKNKCLPQYWFVVWYNVLTHWGRVMHVCITAVGHLVICLVPSHYLNQWWFIANLASGNQFQLNSNQNWKVFIEGNAFEMLTARHQPFCFSLNGLKGWRHAQSGRRVLPRHHVIWVTGVGGKT